MPRPSRLSILMYCSWTRKLLSSEVICFKRLSLTVLVAARDDSFLSSLFYKLSKLLDRFSLRSQKIPINVPRSFCGISTKVISFSCFKHSFILCFFKLFTC